MDTDEIKDLIYEYAIKNAHDYGKANFGSVLSKVISKAPEVKNDLPKLRSEVIEIVGEVNSMSKESVNDKYESYSRDFTREYNEKLERTSKANITIEGAEEGKVVTRFPPEPGGYIHIGNAKQCILSDEISKLYKGKIYLYWDDTNPEKCKEEYVESIKRDTKWLGVNFAREYYASDFLLTIYDYGKKLINQGDAYVCTCSNEEINKGRMERTECVHRSKDVKYNLTMFEKMINNELDEGSAVVRLKGDMESDNSAMRDPTLFRIKKVPHYKLGTKYVVWPTYHINTPILDSINGVTDTIRGKEYEIWEDVHKFILNRLGLRVPRMHYEARLNIEGTITQKRVIRDFMGKGYIKSWDDPRLVTIAALRRRGIQPEAIRKFVLKFGMSKNDTTVKMDMLLSENEKMIRDSAKHLFFINNPKEISTNKDEEVSLKVYPDSDSSEYRKYNISKIYLNESDSSLNDAFQLNGVGPAKISDNKIELGDFKYKGKVNWLPKGYIKASIMFPGPIVDKTENYNPDSLSIREGYTEPYASNLSNKDIVFFEGIGYCVLDNKDDMQFIFIS